MLCAKKLPSDKTDRPSETMTRLLEDGGDSHDGMHRRGSFLHVSVTKHKSSMSNRRTGIERENGTERNGIVSHCFQSD